MIVSATRFTEVDLMIAQKAKENQVPVSFVRTKFDQDFHNAKRQRSKKTPRELADEIRNNIIKALKEGGCGDCSGSVYIVSSPAFLDENEQRTDEDLLVERLLSSAVAARSMHPAFLFYFSISELTIVQG